MLIFQIIMRTIIIFIIILEDIMKTSVIGFPRIGTLRKLKFASEKYFRKEIDSYELLETAKALRKTH